MERKKPGQARIDLGAATKATRGAIGFYSDDVLKRETPGLSAE
jgi:hypothetical protein